MKKMNKKGFTLIEMLAVIAIIAVLVAIVVPAVGSSTEKAKEAADAANIRSMIAEITTKGLSDGEDVTNTYTMTQDGAFDKTNITDIAGFEISKFEVAKDTVITITYNAESSTVSITAGSSNGGNGGTSTPTESTEG